MSRLIREYIGMTFRDAGIEDIRHAVLRIEGCSLSDWTKKDYKIFIKRFYKWLRGFEEEDTYPPEVKWIKARMKNKKRLPEDILNEEEIKQLAAHTKTIRDRAFILGLYESGCQIGEFLSLQIRNVTFDEYGAVLRVSGKTGDRRVRILASTPAFGQWIEQHPFKASAARNLAHLSGQMNCT